ncbi:MAG TPA: acyl-CoA dehydrogenase family protein [Dehalococcoidia bacterium]|nr:acyl-CoA dehydrogenase family protein [Dehalococcoidia bacterium]
MSTQTPTEAIEKAQRLAADFATRAAIHDRDASFPFENFDALRDAGLLNLTTPEEMGGDGFGIEVVCRVVQAIATGDPSTALVLQFHYLNHAGIARGQRWPRPIYEKFCRESLEGIALINNARVEPELGTPARGGLPATTARRTPDGWSLSGRKIYVTGAPILRYVTVWARTDEDPLRVGSFLVPMATKGVSIDPSWDHLGMRATGSDDLVLDNVEIPDEYAIDVRPPEAWLPGQSGPVQQGSLALSAVYNGVAIASRNWLVRYLNERAPTNLGAPLATLPRFQSAVGEIEALLYANDRLIYTLAADVDSGRRTPLPAEGEFVKQIVTENAIRATHMAVELTGNPGLSRANPLERHYRDALCGRVHSPQADVVFAGAGRTALAPG